MRKIKFVFLTVFLNLCVCISSAHAALIDFSVSPNNGDIEGAPNTTIGWGYSIKNNSSNYLVTTALNADVFQYGLPLSIFDFPVIAPGETVSKSYSQDISGLFQLTWDIDALIDFVNAGAFILSSDFYTGDPLQGGQFIATADEVVAFYSAKVTQGQTSVPEPSSIILCLLGLGLLGLRRLKV